LILFFFLLISLQIDHLVSRLASQEVRKYPVDMFMAIRCTSLEIVASYCLNRTLDAIDYPDFQHPFILGLQSAIPFFWVLKYFPFLTPLATNPSEWFIGKWPKLAHVFEFRRDVQREIEEILDNPDVLLKAEHPKEMKCSRKR